VAQDIAIIIPAYNAATTIQETLVSIQAQKSGLDRVREVLVADDASTDETVHRVRACWNCSIPLRLLERKTNVGQWLNLNEAIEELGPDTQWFFILHADDIAKPHWLAEMIRVIGTCESRVASVTASFDVLHSDGQIDYGEDFGDARREIIRGNAKSIADTIERGCWWKISSCSIRFAAYREIGQFRSDFPYMSDLNFVLRTLAAGWSIEYIPQRLSIYRQMPSGVSSKSFRVHQDVREWLAIIRDFSGYLSFSQKTRLLIRLFITLNRRIAASAFRRDWRRAWDAAKLLGSVVGAARRRDAKHA
jgi:glycosyltransferase involved in cell wall biosynthesis